jgi:hypothetical protein
LRIELCGAQHDGARLCTLQLILSRRRVRCRTLHFRRDVACPFTPDHRN